MKRKEEPMNDLLAPSEPAPLARRGVEDVPIGAILNMAVEKGISTESMEKLVALYERVNAQTAAKAFSLAMAAFKAECPAIPRRTENNQFFVTTNGVKRPRRYAALEDIEATIRAPLGKHGLSFRWGDSTIKDGIMTLTCIVTHSEGHSVSSSVSMPVESRAGCSDQQKYGSAGTYAQRYSLIQALGLTSCDEDDDGNPPADAGPKITEAQAANIEHMLAETKSNVPVFLEWCQVEKIADIPASRFREVVKALEEKREKNKSGGKQ